VVKYDVARGRATFQRGGSVTPDPWTYRATMLGPQPKSEDSPATPVQRSSPTIGRDQNRNRGTSSSVVFLTEEPYRRADHLFPQRRCPVPVLMSRSSSPAAMGCDSLQPKETRKLIESGVDQMVGVATNAWEKSMKTGQRRCC
jgi:hypothetical protein